MKFFWLILSGAILCVLLQLLLPWWIFAVLTFTMFLFISVSKIYKAFFSGLLIVTTAWLALYLYFDNLNAGLLSNRMAQLFGMQNHLLFLIISSLVMGIAGGLSAGAGYALRNIRK